LKGPAFGRDWPARGVLIRSGPSPTAEARSA
jgi:hypothetical protein